MELLSLEDVDTVSAEIERAIDETPEIDPWCSGPDWVLPVHQGFAPGSRVLLARVGTPRGPGFALLARYLTEDGRSALAGLDPLWGFAAPLVGPDVGAVAAALAAVLADDPTWDLVWLAGMPRPTGPRSYLPRVVEGLGPLGRVGVTPGMASRLADLSAGYGPWLARRSPRFRRNLRRVRRLADQAGVVFTEIGDDPAAFDRILEIERRSWKGRDDGGITGPEMTTTYRAMIERLRSTGRLRLTVARLDDRDVGYILGGVRNRTYRGLQLSYDDGLAELSIGHLLQLHHIGRLTDRDEVDVYDLGMDMAYKERWSDSLRTSTILVIDRHGAAG